MANITVRNLPAAISLSGTEELNVVQNGTSVRTTTAAVAGLSQNTGTVTSVSTNAPLTGGPIVSSGTISLASGGVTNQFLAAMTGGTIKGAISTGQPVDLTAAQTLSLIGAASSAITITAGAGLTGGGNLTANRTIAFSTVADNRLLANITGGVTEPTPVTLSAYLDYIGSSAQGAVLYRSATGWTALSPGTSGQLLSTQGASANPVWRTVSGAGTVTNVATGTGLTGGPITVSGTVSIANTGVTAATYGSASTSAAIAVNAQGQITSAASTPIVIANTQVTGLGTISVQNANSVAISGGTIDGAVIGGSAPAAGTFTSLTATSSSLGTVASGTWQGTAVAGAYGGTGQTSVTTGDLLYGSASNTWSRLADVATGNALISGGIGVAPAYGKIGLTTHVSGTLPVGNGGTGLSSTPSNGQLLIGNGTGYTANTLTAGAGISVTNSTGTITIANSTLGTVTSVDVSGGTTGLTTSGGPITASGTITLGGTLNVANGGTGATTAPNARANLSAAVLGANADITSLTGLTTALGAAYGGTGQLGGYTAGDILYASGASVLSKLADVATGNALISGGIGIAPSYGKIGLTTHVSGTLGIGNGGTGLNATPTNGQLLIGNGTGYTNATITAGAGITVTNGSGAITITSTASGGTVTSIAVSGGTTGLTTSGGPVTAAGTITLAGTLVAANGGTGQSSYAVGDLLYASGSTALSKLADVATGNALISGGIGVAPSYGKIGLTTHVSGTLAVGNGGTGITTTPSNGQIPIGNGTNYTATTLTAGPGIAITNASGAITLATATPPSEASQTVWSGPVDSSGYAAFGGSVGSATLTTSGTLYATAAAGATDYFGSITNAAFTSPSGSGTGYLYLDITAAGVVSASVATLAPAYQWGGTYSVTNGQNTYNIQERTMKVGNGSTAATVYRVFIGECPYTSSVWSGTITWYALMGRYISAEQTITAGTLVSLNHNIGVQPLNILHVIRCKTTELGWAVGDEVPNPFGNPSSGVAFPAIGANRLSVKMQPGSFSRSYIIADATSGAFGQITNASWRQLAYVSRGW